MTGSGRGLAQFKATYTITWVSSSVTISHAREKHFVGTPKLHPDLSACFSARIIRGVYLLVANDGWTAV